MQAITGNLGIGARAAALIAIIALTALLLLVTGGAFSASASGTATASRTVTVSMKNFFFAPKNVSISRGDRVVWSNVSSRPHTATRGGSFDTGRIKPGKAAAVKFNGRARLARAAPFSCKWAVLQPKLQVMSNR